MNRIIRKITPAVPMLPKKKRVAAYARVSTGKDWMLHSLSAQISHYSNMIQKRADWEYVGVYADEAITGTKDNRAEFQRMIADCRSGKIDLIMTKSISRFARNTVTMLNTVRELRSINVDVYFEKENIHSISGDGELMLTILASYAQEESRSVSENCKWRIRKQFQSGELANFRFMFGYRVRKGKIEIDPEQAEVIRMIFADYIGGSGCVQIAKKLRRMGIQGIRGAFWSPARVVSILGNEKYAGNALLQKRYVKDHLTKQLVRNNSVLPMYFAKGTHEAIIDPATFDQARQIMTAKQENLQSALKEYLPFSGLIRCGGCGKKYKRITVHGKKAWQCTTFKEQGKNACPARKIPENILLDLTARALGISGFDELAFKTRISELVVPEANRVAFIFHDARRIEYTWQHRSRRDSWSDEDRLAARQRTLAIRRRSS